MPGRCRAKATTGWTDSSAPARTLRARASTAVTGGSTNASFVYAADGSRTVGTVDGVTTVYIGGVYEWQAGASTAYYAGPEGPVAFRRSGYATDNGVFYLLRDHLGSSSVIVDGSD